MSSNSAAIPAVHHDPITIEIIQNSLRAVTDEMFAAMRKTAMSSIIYEVLDFGVALFDARGDLASTGAGIPGFIGMLEPGVKAVIRKFGQKNAIHQGDIFILNIPHHGGVSHLNDVVLILPIFAEEEIVGWLANKAHWVDVGGAFPGSISPTAVDVYQEGLQLPCVKVIEKGRPNQAVIDIIVANSRMPETTLGDFWAGVASMRAGEHRYLELVSKYGKAAVLYAIEDYINLAEAISREALKGLAPGRYEAAEILEDGREVRAAVTVASDEFVVDLRGNPAQSKSSFNISRDCAMAEAQMIFKAVTSPHTFANSGSFRPLKLLVDNGSMFAAEYPSAMGVYYEAGIMLFDLLWKALAPAFKERLPAGHYASICGTFMGGPHPEGGKHHSIVEPQLGGWGAAYDRDGVSALYTGSHGDTFNVSVEVGEQRNGIRVERLSLSAAPGGEGEYVGGKGVNLDYRILADDWWVTMVYHRSKQGPWGLEGGLEGSTNYIRVVRRDGSAERYSSCTALELNKGDVVQVYTATGGGYGDPRKRPRAKVLSDIKNGYVSAERAREVYAIAI